MPPPDTRATTLFQFVKFLGVGIANTLVGLATIYAAKWFLGAGDVAANASGYAVGLIVSFTLNSRWTFSYQGPRQAAALRFLGVAAIAYCMNLLTVMTAIESFGINAYVAQALGVPPYTITSFLLSKYFVFHPLRSMNPTQPLPQTGRPLATRTLHSLGAATIVAFLGLSHLRVTHGMPWPVLASLTLFLVVCLTYGRAFLAATAGLLHNRAGLCLQFLVGFLLFNTLLFITTLASPLGMRGNLLMLAVGALGLGLFGRRYRPREDESELPALLCIVLSAVGAMLWASDAQTQPVIQGTNVVYQTWQDLFFHVRQISAFAQAQGGGTLHQINSAEAPAQIYHYAIYQSAAALTVLTDTPSIEVYASFLLPFGLFLLGLAAFSLIASIWGAWPALAAMVAALLVPDAYLQGFANRYLSYHFMTQVNLGSAYGIACVAVAWIFTLEACRRGKLAPLFVGYVFLALSLTYKAHLFVANAYLILIYPCLFFSGVRLRSRLLAGLALTSLFVTVVMVSQSLERIPTMRLDGSGIGTYLLQLLSDFDEGQLKTYFTRVLKLEHHSRVLDLLHALALISISTFGLWLVAMPVLAAAARKKIPSPILALPFLVLATYLIMTVGLALDDRGIGTPDELLNRPLVWAYFVVAAWTAGCAYHLALGNRLPSSTPARTALIGLVALALSSPLFFSRNLQTFPAWKDKARYEEFNAVPICLSRAAEFIRDNSHPSERIQDSENDPRFILTALTERQSFAGASIFARPTKALQERLDELKVLRTMQDAGAIRGYLTTHRVSWYLLQPDASVAWPTELLDSAAFECEGYRVFRFGT